MLIMNSLAGLAQCSAIAVLLIACTAFGVIKFAEVGRQLHSIELAEAEEPFDEAQREVAAIEHTRRITYCNPIEALLAVHVIVQKHKYKRMQKAFSKWRIIH